MSRLSRFVSWVLILVLGWVGLVSGPVEGQPRLLESARDHYRIGDVHTAWDLTRRALRKHPDSSDVWLFYGRLASHFQDSVRTRRVFRNVLARTRNPAPFVEFLSTTSTDTSHYLPLLEWGFRNGVYDTGLVQLYADRLIRARSYSLAREVLRTARGRFPASEQLTFLLARVQLGRGNCRRAGTLLRELTRKRPGRARNYRWFSKVLLGRGQRNASRVLFARYRALSARDISWERFSREIPVCR